MLLPIVSNLPRSCKTVRADASTNLRPVATPIAIAIVLHGAGHGGEAITIRASNRGRGIAEAAAGAAHPAQGPRRVAQQAEALGRWIVLPRPRKSPG
jgi:hypothetical protein